MLSLPVPLGFITGLGGSTGGAGSCTAAIRQTMGATRPTEAAPGSLRHDFALEVGRNLTHASDTVENGANEVALWFRQEELVNWTREVDRWVFEK